MSTSGFLHRYFLANSHKLMDKWIHYFDIYERHLHRFRQRAPVIVEIGVSGGGSLAMWKEYFGNGCRIVGIDIDPTCKAHEAEGIEIFIGSQDDPDLIANIKARYPRIDVVIDDGSHIMYHMVGTLDLLYDTVDPHGVYIVEDTHTCYWPSFGGGVKQPGSFMEFAKDRLDELNAVHSLGALRTSDFTRSTEVVCFYDSVVVFERRPQGARRSIQTQPM